MKNECLILSSYFSLNPHPNNVIDESVVGVQQDGKVWDNDFNYIKSWYESILKNNIKGVIFHDNLHFDFISKYENENIKFVKTEVDGYSNNDFRFFCFYDYLEKLTEAPAMVFHNDISDVVVVKNPIDLLNEFQNIDYFCCKDSIPLSKFPYIQAHQHYNWNDSVKFMLNDGFWELINMGVIGGDFTNMKEFYRCFVEVRSNMKDYHFNADMWVLQYLLRSKLSEKSLLIGDPVCSEFKKYQNDRKDVYFIHK
jgi:hypothetical protein